MVHQSYSKSENLIKLKELSDKLCEPSFQTVESDDNYKKVFGEISNVIENSEDLVDDVTTTDEKIKCYESMCSKLKGIVNKINLFK